MKETEKRHPKQPYFIGLAPNAATQPCLEAGARYERTLEGIGCSGLFGKTPRHVCGPQCAPHTYWITSSARRSSDGGIVIPSALAVLKLITSSNLVGWVTGIRRAWRP